ncbi:unnamed protein product [Mytilus coruscus]|uniref:Fibrinogen C-terminal domain-containing protein n=1 Tax=Mytilus coruscus TaxID=42192 RepID=A0A6J8ARS6_MYTCO|nr:unnamed protein product [Mytilus coruscus]
MDEMQRAPLVAVLNTSDISRNILENLEEQLTTRVRQIVQDTVGDIIRQQISAKFNEIGIVGDTSRKDVFTLKNSIAHTDDGVFRDCSDIPDGSRSGIYTIKPDHSQGIEVYCEMKIDGGGWTVIKRRENGYLDFYLGWEKYKEGFSTFDQDNDASIYNNAEEWHGGWWYKSNDIYSILHWKYFFGEPDKFWEGLLWRTWKGNNYSLKSTIMMIRRM